MQKRKRTDPNRPNWVQQLISMKETVATMSSGADRDLAHQRASQLEAAIGIDGWLRPIDHTQRMKGYRPDSVHSSDYRFLIVGDKRVGWSIRAIGDGGQEEQLLGFYPSRTAAEDDLHNAAQGIRRHE